MDILLSILIIWLGIFADGLFIGLFGVSIISILALFYYKKWSALRFATVFLIISVALDFIDFSPLGWHFAMILLLLGISQLIQKLFSRWDQVGHIFGISITCFIYLYVYEFGEMLIEKGSVSSVFEPSQLGVKLFGAVFLTLIYLFWNSINSIFFKSTQSSVKLK